MIENKRSIDTEFVVMRPDKNATVERFDAELYTRLDRDYDGFKGHELISCHFFSEDWPSWEIHPNGDEVVILLSGEVTMVLALAEGEQAISLEEQGSYVIVPANIWHTARTNSGAKLLFITPGEGTQHKSD